MTISNRDIIFGVFFNKKFHISGTKIKEECLRRRGDSGLINLNVLWKLEENIHYLTIQFKLALSHTFEYELSVSLLLSVESMGTYVPGFCVDISYMWHLSHSNDWFLYLDALCLNVFEQKLQRKKILHPLIICQCDQHQHPSAKQRSVFKLINMIL